MNKSRKDFHENLPHWPSKWQANAKKKSNIGKSFKYRAFKQKGQCQEGHYPTSVLIA